MEPQDEAHHSNFGYIGRPNFEVDCHLEEIDHPVSRIRLSVPSGNLQESQISWL